MLNKRTFLWAVLFAYSFTGLQAATFKVLAVGNSFSQNALHYFKNIVEASGNQTVAVNCMIGGCDFERHMRHADAFEANPNDPEGRPYPGKLSLKELLTQDSWDYVSIQQASAKSFASETYYPHVERLVSYIQKYAPQAEIIIHQTWAYRDDHPFTGLAVHNPDEMYRGLRSAYDALAQQTHFRMIPSGDAMETARRDSAWGKFEPDRSFDREKATAGELPTGETNALHMGYLWKPNKQTGVMELSLDAKHANRLGEYLVGCVWFEFFSGQSVLGNSYAPKEVNANEMGVMQKIAHKVVTEKQRPVLASE